MKIDINNLRRAEKRSNLTSYVLQKMIGLILSTTFDIENPPYNVKLAIDTLTSLDIIVSEITDEYIKREFNKPNPLNS